jgi:putative nucleotidyltransferase with HDIG domain
MAAVPNDSDRLTDLSVKKVLSNVGEIAVMPQVVYKIIELTGDTMTAAQEIESAIAIDPGFTSKVLMLVNSAFYALPRKMTSIREAVTFLGYKTVRQLAMTVGVFDMFVGKADAGSLRRRTWWRHSIDTAIGAQAIAQSIGIVNPDEAYSCGLLHDVGKMLLERYGQGDYADVEHFVTNGFTVLEAEVKVYGCDHAQVGAAAATQWGFPSMLSDCIAHHHQPKEVEHKHHLAIVALANEIAHLILIGRGDNAELCPWACNWLNIDQKKAKDLYDICKTAITKKSGTGI